MTLLTLLMDTLDKKANRMIAIRRYLHEHPELSFEEEETAAYISNFYTDVPVDTIETNVGGHRGVVVTIKGAQPGKTIALRADFDALPIQEETNVPFSSKTDGVMHACGHDGHTAYMLILAESLAEMKEELKGTIKIIHQPAEEMPPGGAKAMIEAGVLDDVDAVFGAHVMSEMETGKVFYRSGPTQTGRAKFVLSVKGEGGHGSSPHTANDAIVAASSFVMNVQTVVSRRINPFDTAVVTIGSFDGKGQFNVIKDAVTLEGDVRTMSDEARDTVEKEVRQLAEGLEAMYGVTVDLDYKNDYPVLYNNPETTEAVRQAIGKAEIPEISGVVETGPIPPSEDFAYFAKERPATFFFVGARPDENKAFPHHHPKFDINEKSLMIAAKAMASVALTYCS